MDFFNHLVSRFQCCPQSDESLVLLHRVFDRHPDWGCYPGLDLLPPFPFFCQAPLGWIGCFPLSCSPGLLWGDVWWFYNIHFGEYPWRGGPQSSLVWMVIKWPVKAVLAPGTGYIAFWFLYWRHRKHSCLMLMAPLLARLALKFGPPEYYRPDGLRHNHGHFISAWDPSTKD